MSFLAIVCHVKWRAPCMLPLLVCLSPPPPFSLEQSVSSSLPDADGSVLHRSMTVSSTDFKRERKKERQSSVKTATELSPLHSSISGDSRPTSTETGQHIKICRLISIDNYCHASVDNKKLVLAG